MSNNVLSFIIEGKDKFTSTMNKVKGTLAELGADWKRAMAGMKEGSYSGLLTFAMKLGPAVVAAGAAIKGLGASIKWIGEGLTEFAKLETATIRLSKLTGSMESARAAMQELTEGKDSVKDLFGDQDVIQAAIALKRLSGGALGSAEDIKVLAGAAYNTGQTVSAVAQDIGALTGMITEGVTGWERYAKGLAKAGVLSFETIKQMTEMKDAGKSAGEIVAFMWDQLNRQHSGSIDAARDSIEGMRSKANEAYADMKRELGSLFEPVSKFWNFFKEHGSNAISFIVTGIKDLAEFVGTFFGALSTGDGFKKAYNAALDDYERKANPAKGEKGDLASSINARAGKSEEQVEKEKKAADDASAEYEAAVDRKKKAEDAYFAAKATNQQKLKKLQDEEDALGWKKFELNGSSELDSKTALLDVEARLTEIATERAAIEKDITKAKEDQAKKAESLMERDQRLKEARMTPKERMEASKKRVDDLTRQLAGETDPDKRLEISGKLMDEAEKQQGMKGGGRSLSLGDAIAKKKGQLGAPDPAKEQVDILKTIKGVLEKIEKKRGGMAP